MSGDGVIEWAEEEFAGAELGDRRRTERLVEVAAGAAAHPAGHITEVFDEGAARTGAYRLLENEQVAPEALAQAARQACVQRSVGFAYVFVPVDGSSLNISDWQRSKGLGVVGRRFVGAQGLQVMSAIAVSPDGTPLGLAAQTWWARRGRARRKRIDRRALESRETHKWLMCMRPVVAAYDRIAPSCRPWFQIDRGGDSWPVLLEGLEPGRQLFTVRAAYDRRVEKKADEQQRYLWQTIEACPVMGRYELNVPAGPGRIGRKANIEVRARQVTLDLKEYLTKRHHLITVWAVLAREVDSAANAEHPIEWLLLTSYPVKRMEDARRVLFGYAQRWRIEEFHRIWKSGACRVEQTQLREKDAIVRWATILATVAVRILRLTYLARATPEVPATVEFRQSEIDAVLLLKRSKKYRPGDAPPIEEVVRLLAELGGYTGKSSGGPPGALVITRGLERIASVAELLESREM
jgi:hypothetical protein